jgi:hypothetical protein
VNSTSPPSHRTTDFPAKANLRAKVIPAAPAPTTQMSQVSPLCGARVSRSILIQTSSAFRTQCPPRDPTATEAPKPRDARLVGNWFDSTPSSPERRNARRPIPGADGACTGSGGLWLRPTCLKVSPGHGMWRLAVLVLGSIGPIRSRCILRVIVPVKVNFFVLFH